MAAFENYDVKRIVELLAEDAVWEMPPYLGWYQGSTAIGHLIETHCPAEAPGDQDHGAHLRPTVSPHLRCT